MIAKTFEVRDRMTFIPVLAVKLEPVTREDEYLLARSGYGGTRGEQATYVQLFRLAGGEGEANCNPFAWGGRTLPTAHQYIIDNFDVLESGALIDVEVVLKEKEVPVVSESVSSPLE